MFCGVGLLAIRIGAARKKNFRAVCNDPNPLAISYCNEIILINDVEDTCFAFNKDPREFLKFYVG